MSCNTLAYHIDDIAIANTLSDSLKFTDRFSVVKSRILPQLNPYLMINQPSFCEGFFILWLSAKCMKQKVETIKTHIDKNEYIWW